MKDRKGREIKVRSHKKQFVMDYMDATFEPSCYSMIRILVKLWQGDKSKFLLKTIFNMKKK